MFSLVITIFDLKCPCLIWSQSRNFSQLRLAAPANKFRLLGTPALPPLHWVLKQTLGWFERCECFQRFSVQIRHCGSVCGWTSPAWRTLPRRWKPSSVRCPRWRRLWSPMKPTRATQNRSIPLPLGWPYFLLRFSLFTRICIRISCHLLLFPFSSTHMFLVIVKPELFVSAPALYFRKVLAALRCPFRSGCS